MRVLLNLSLWCFLLTAFFFILFSSFSNKEYLVVCSLFCTALFFVLAIVFLLVAATIRVAYKDKEIMLSDGKITYLGTRHDVSEIQVNMCKQAERSLGHFIHVKRKIYFVEKVNKEELFTNTAVTGKAKLSTFSKDYDYFFGAVRFVDFDFVGDIFR